MKSSITIQSIEDVINRPLFTCDGKKIGHVLDMQFSPRPEFKIHSLLSGRYGLLHRLHVIDPFAKLIGVDADIDTFDWKDVERIEDGRIILRISHAEYTHKKQSGK